MSKYAERCLFLLFFSAFLALTNPVTAQPGDPGDDPDVPVDGGVTLLVAAGIGYGAKRYRDAKKRNPN